ncbi:MULTISPECIES: DUF397 domain-containing protein [unclassified Streptomyces]|uniref:DUF397 domain-containing protein n=1 Tax=unclassified Streptomyces TaxID=2593676 RepID=UPI0004C57E49|nr:DUF397 domain-containing protein [Streptomyces sp. NRRL F-5630]
MRTELLLTTGRASPPWRKSSYSNYDTNCVEVASYATHLAVRDSKVPASPHLGFSPPAWRRFLDSAHG